MNGVLAGLVAGTAGIHLYDESGSVVVGALGAFAMIACAEALDALRIDDVVGAVPVHLAAGIVGALAVPFLAPLDALPAGSVMAQFSVQVLGASVVGAWVLGVIFPAGWTLKRAGLLRAPGRSEVLGLNLTENRRHNAFEELLNEMKSHTRSSSFKGRVRVERSTEAGALAIRYNAVMDRVEDEILRRMDAMRRESEMREMAEDAFDAMRKAHEENAWAARHDDLTGLGNRKLLDEITTAPSQAGDGEVGQLIVAIDLDRFKDVNDTYGHEAGDLVLSATGNRLRTHLRGGRDFAFRIGGDEFVLLLDFEGSDTTAQWICDTILEEILEPTMYRGVGLRVGGSIGFSRVEPGEAMEDALKRADLALYDAKAQGRSQAIAYNATIGAAHDARLTLANDFKKALDRDEITIELQPQVDAKTHALSGIEVLVRWMHPKRGRQSPAVFMDIAEDLNMIADLDRRVLDLALEAREALIRALGDIPDMAVNVSARRLMSFELLDELSKRENLPSEGLAFEILETAFLDEMPEELAATIAEIKKMGISIEVDDFGTGHASLASVLALQPDRLKIDRMFVPGVDKDPHRRELLQGLIEMSQRVSARTVVEGVETMAEAQVITATGAGALQGFAFSRPLPVEEFIFWARDWEKQRAA